MKREILFHSKVEIRKLLMLLLVLALILSGCGVSESSETTVPTQPPETVQEETTQPVSTSEPPPPVIMVNEWLTMNGEAGMIEYPEEFFPDFLAEVESAYRRREGTAAYISYIGPEEGSEQILDLGLCMYRMEYQVEGPNPIVWDALFLYHREDTPDAQWVLVDIFSDYQIEEYVISRLIPDALLEQYENWNIAAAVWYWNKITAPITHPEHIDRLIKMMNENGDVTISYCGEVIPYGFNALERALWENIKDSYGFADIDPYEGDAEYVKIEDGEGNYLCIYNGEKVILELCEAGCSPTWWRGRAKYLEADWFDRYRMFYYSAEVDFTQYTCYAEDYLEAIDIIGRMIPARHLNVKTDNPNYALEYEILRDPMVGSEVMIGFVAEDGTWAEGSVYYAIRQPELSFDAYGNVNEGTGEWEGWLMIHQWYKVVYLGDGLWGCKTA